MNFVLKRAWPNIVRAMLALLDTHWLTERGLISIYCCLLYCPRKWYDKHFEDIRSRGLNLKYFYSRIPSPGLLTKNCDQRQASKFLWCFYRTRVRSLGMLVSNSLTNSLLFNKLDWCDPGMWRRQLPLVEVVTVAYVDAEDHVGNSLLIWELTFGHKTNLLFRLWAQGLVKILAIWNVYYN